MAKKRRKKRPQKYVPPEPDLPVSMTLKEAIAMIKGAVGRCFTDEEADRLKTLTIELHTLRDKLAAERDENDG